jgi:hypothetical protein
MNRLLFAAARGARIERLDGHAPRIVTLMHLQPEDGFVSAARAIADDHESDWAMHYANELHRSLALLILAEALADEGL